MSARVCTAAFLLAVGVLLMLPGCSDDGAGQSGLTPGPPTSAPSAPTASTTAAPTPSSTSPQASRPPTDQTTPRPDGVVRIIAVEVAPEDPSPGGQYVLLFNGTAEPVNLACWSVRSASTGITAQVRTGTTIPPGAALRLFPDGRLFGSVDTVRLSGRDGREVDRTPQITDRTGDDQVWFRDRTGGWRFGRGLAVPPQVVDGRLAFESTGCQPMQGG